MLSVLLLVVLFLAGRRQVMNSLGGEWILQRRMTEARLLLGETETAIGVVAAHCGFHTVGHFGRQFRRLQGMSPS